VRFFDGMGKIEEFLKMVDIMVEFFVYCCLYTVKFCLSVMCKIYDRFY